MSFRVSTSQTFTQGTNAILDNQSKVSLTQLQLSKGTRILKPSDDPIGSSVALNLQRQIDNTTQYIANGQAAQARLATEDSVMDNVSSILGRVRELALLGANGTLNHSDREAICIEIEQRYDELLGLANTQLSSGEYMFSGFQSNVQPFSKNGTGSVVYNGDQGVQMINVNSTVQVESGNSGDAIFMSIPTGNGSFVTGADDNNTGTGVIGSAVMDDPTAYVGDVYTIDFSLDGGGNLVYQVTGANTGPVYAAPLPSFDEDGVVTFNGISYTISGLPAAGDSFTVEPSYAQDVFTSVKQIVDALKKSTDTDALQATFRNALGVGMNNLDQAITHMDEVRAGVGSRLNVIESETNINESLLVEAKSALSLIVDLDYASAVTELNKQTLALQAAQQSFVKIQGLTLFEFI